MGKKLNPFLNGSQVVIKVGNQDVALAQSINFSESIPAQLIHALGDYEPLLNEPMLHNGVSGQIRIISYSDYVISDSKAIPEGTRLGQWEGSKNVIKKSDTADGNSLITKCSFTPELLLLSSTFDIDIYVRTGSTAELKKVYVIEDCLVSGANFSLQAGSPMQAVYSYLGCRIVEVGVDLATGQ